MADPLRPTDPRSIGRYRTLRRLGAGGMGSVYLAEDPAGRLVAVKVIRPEYAHEPEYRARFRSEVNRAREVPPFCTAEVLDADPDHETPYLVVEYVDGPSLDEVVADQGPLTGAACTVSPSAWRPRSPPSTEPGSSTVTSSPATCCSPSAPPR
ncbi:serine/threonine protein kinase [Actinoplanes sp. CA-252034]|uniref:serine/threonine protein kinase n=1 Tax=Actinoplanes sp. CA-252034 TaxID=3239906 RepID=UPI003D97343C